MVDLTKFTGVSGPPGRGRPPPGVERAAFRERRTGAETEAARQAASRNIWRLAWELVTNKQFQTEMGITQPTSQQLRELANRLVEENTPEEIEQAFANLAGGERVARTQFGFETPITEGPPASYEKLRKAIELAIGGALNGEIRGAGEGGRKQGADLAMQFYTMPDEELDELYQISKKTPTEKTVTRFLPETVPQPTGETPGRQMRLTPEDIRKFAAR